YSRWDQVVGNGRCRTAAPVSTAAHGSVSGATAPGRASADTVDASNPHSGHGRVVLQVQSLVSGTIGSAESRAMPRTYRPHATRRIVWLAQTGGDTVPEWTSPSTAPGSRRCATWGPSPLSRRS